MKKFVVILFITLICKNGYTQENCDTIYTNNEILIVKVKEVTPDAVIYQYPGETITNSIYKNSIIRIVFSSGRKQVFNEISNFKTVKGGNDWEKVTITHVESEVKGLFKLGQVTSKASGTTEFSNMNKVKDRAYKKLKIEAAMRGANMIYLFEEYVKGNDYSDNSTETSLTGIAYANIRPLYADFQELLNKYSEFTYIQLQYLGNNSTDLNIIPIYPEQKITFNNIYNEAGFIMVKTHVNDIYIDTFTVTYFDDKEVILMYEDKTKIYNLILISY